ncbi:GNAT family N-acetyltransferase [Leifsonia sp. NPDC080035]|uniref:GNAT family N-acetyltransferase n=1 Tax=Leifsonia sp. NPDC080035 TaxID=3143936 RepID=A0AAU7GA10_9MICO
MRALLLRPASAADADAVADVFLAARAGMTYLPALHTEEETRSWIAGVVLPGCSVTVAIEGTAVLGFSALDGDWLEHLYVRPDAHGRGIGTRLLAEAKATGPGELNLHTFQRNARARRFYERNGFAIVALSDGTANEEREPDIHYRWTRDA